MPDNENFVPQNIREQELTNNYMHRLSSYVNRDQGFVKLIRGLESYLSNAGGVLAYTIDKHNQPAQNIDDNTDIAYLARLVNKLGISLDYFPSDYFTNTNMSVNGVWVFNNTPTLTTQLSQDINFICNDVQYSEIRQSGYNSNGSIQFVRTSDSAIVTAYNSTSGGWQDNVYKTIDFGTSQIVSQEFYNFLSNTATTQDEQLDSRLTTLRSLYLLAIRGAVINRVGNATKAQLQQALQTMYEQADIEIVDGGLDESVGLMSVTVNIKGITTSLNSAVLSLYLKQNITGVQEQFNFDVSGVGVFAPVISNGESGDNNLIEFVRGEDSEDEDSLWKYFTDNPTLPYGYDSEDKAKAFGMGGYMWADVQKTGTGDNEFVDSSHIPPVPTTSADPTYLGTAFWMIQLITY